jgi:hypothetical protein
MGEYLLLRGEAHLVSSGQVSGRCIHHAAPRIAPQSPKFLIAIAMIETSFWTLLVLPTCCPLPNGTHERSAWLHAVPPATAAPPAKDQKNAATSAATLDSELDHRKPTPKSWLPREHRRSCAHTSAAHLSRMLVSNLKARSG